VKRLRVLSTFLLLFITIDARAQGVKVITGVTVIDGTAREPIKDAVIVIDGSRIREVGPARTITLPSGATTIDAQGKFVIPGLADMHNHHLTGGLNFGRQDLKRNLQRLLTSGVTTTFSMSADSASFADLKRAAAGDSAPYPRFYGVGPGFATLGGYRPNTPAEARDLVRRLKSENVDAIKIAYDDMSWATTQAIPALNPNVMAAIISESHVVGLKAYVHAPILKYAKEALRAGADGLVHGIVSDPVDEEFIALMKKNGAVYISTLSLFEACADIRGWTRRLEAFDQKGTLKAMWTEWANPASLRQFEAIYNNTSYVTKRMPIVRANLKQVSQAGIPIVAGTDTGFPGVVLGVSSVMEIVLHVDAGLSPQAAIQAATISAAAMTGHEKELGTIEAGKLADLVVLDADPMADISNLRRIYRVIKGGVVYSF